MSALPNVQRLQLLRSGSWTSYRVIRMIADECHLYLSLRHTTVQYRVIKKSAPHLFCLYLTNLSSHANSYYTTVTYIQRRFIWQAATSPGMQGTIIRARAPAVVHFHERHKPVSWLNYSTILAQTPKRIIRISCFMTILRTWENLGNILALLFIYP